MKKFILIFFLLTFTVYGKIKITCKPVIFKEVRAQNNGLYKSKATARGVIEIYSDNIKEDLGKLIVFQVPSHTYITNKKRWVKTDKIIFQKNEQKTTIDSETKKIVFHIILDKKELSKEENSDLIDGVYTGNLPINYSIYEKEMR